MDAIDNTATYSVRFRGGLRMGSTFLKIEVDIGDDDNEIERVLAPLVRRALLCSRIREARLEVVRIALTDYRKPAGARIESPVCGWTWSEWRGSLELRVDFITRTE